MRFEGPVQRPAKPAYDRTVLHRTYDITSLPVPGRYELTAELGRGFYAARGPTPGTGTWIGETPMEAWDGAARSHHHHFPGAASAWIQQRVGGLGGLAGACRESRPPG